MIQIRNLHKRFGKVDVLKGLDLDIRSGGIFAVLGPNGSGKTTLIKSILGMVLPHDGSIRLNEEQILGQWKYRDQINYLPQIARFPANLTVKELIQMVKDIRGQATRDSELIATFGLGEFLGKKLNNLSGGTKQKVNLVLCLMFDAPILILDEPTTGLDPIALIRLKELLQEQKAQGKTILITSHIMSFVEDVADQIVFLLDGQIYFKGAVAQLKEDTKQKNLEQAIAVILEEHLA